MKAFSNACSLFLWLGLGVVALVGLETAARAQAATDFTTASDGSGGLVITGYTGTVKAVVIPGTINGLTVTQIGVSAFNSKASLTSITIPTTVTTLGNNAFFGCTGLTSMTIPASVTSIGFGPFVDCTALTSITVDSANPNYVSTADGVLLDKNQLNLIQYPVGKSGAYVVPSTVTSINRGAFAYCFGLTSVTLPANLISIGLNEFFDCTSLTNVSIPASVTSIGNYAFEACLNLTSAVFNGAAPTTMGASVFLGTASGFTVAYFNSATGFAEPIWNDGGGDTYPSANFGTTTANNQVTITSYAGPNAVIIPAAMNGLPVTAIKNYAFQNQSSLTSVICPSSLISVGQFAFQSDTGLTSLTIPIGVTSLGTDAFEGCSGVTSVSLPATLTTLGSYAFSHCSAVPSITIPNGVTAIQQNTFENCTQLTSIIFPGTLTSIGTNAFQDCTGLDTVTISSSVTSIGQSAFLGCASLETAIFDGDAPTMGNNVFNGANADFATYSYTYASGYTGVGSGQWMANANDTYVMHTILSKFQTSVANNQVTITGHTGSDAAVDIPHTINGVPVVAIGAQAYLNDTALTSVLIPNSVTSIGNFAFLSSGLTSVFIPASVTSMGQAPFSTCLSLTAITVDPANTSFISVNGVLFNHNETTLVEYPAAMSASTYTVPASVITIGFDAFDTCASLTSLSLPDGLTTVSEDAFYSCTGLTSMTLPSHVTSLGNGVFTGCTGLTSVTIPVGVTSIDDQLFYACSSLTSLNIPAGVTTIGYDVFDGCTSLTNVTIPPSVTSIGTSAFVRCSALTSVTIPSKVTSIGTTAFQNCTSLTSAVFDGNAPTMGSNVFGNTNGNFTAYSYAYATGYNVAAGMWQANANDVYPMVVLGSPYTTTVASNQVTITGYTGSGGALDIPSAINGLPVVALANNAFADQTSLTSVTIPTSVTTIGSNAFYDCSALTSVTIPAGVTSLGDNSFENCTQLTNVLIPGTVASIGNYAFFGCSGLTDVTISSGITGLGTNAFENCTHLTSVLIPATVTSIGDFAFFGCSAMVSVTISSGVTGIGTNAFELCTSLTSVAIPASVTSIGQNAFYGSSGLTSAVFNGNAPMTMGSNVFQSVAPGFTVTYFNNATGFTEPAWKANTNDSYSSAAADYGTSVANNQVTITSYAGPIAAVIPSAANGLPVTSIGSSAFSSLATLTRVTIPNSVTSLGDYAFFGCVNLTSVNLPTSLVSIGAYSFFGCLNLPNVTIPKSVISLGVAPFADCTALLAITVDPANPDFISVNGVLFNINETTLIQYPGGNTATSYTIPVSVTSIAPSAFQSCGNLTSVTIPNGLQSIGLGGFAYCAALTSVTLPATVNSIGQQAFLSCTQLTSALFNGNAPTMASGVFQSTASGFTVYYYNGATGFTAPTWTDSSGDTYNSVELTDFSQWIASYPGTSNTAPTATPEKDGVPNLLKYLYDINPSRPMTAADRAALAVFSVDTTTTPGMPFLKLVYREYVSATGITINVQTSPNLKTWTTLNSTQYTNVATGTHDGAGNPYMQISVPASGPRQFLRLNVTQP